MAKTFGVSDTFGEGGAGNVPKYPYRGEDGSEEDLVSLLRGARNRIAAAVADLTALKAIAAADRAVGMIVHKQDDGSLWRFVSSSVTGDDIVIATPSAGSNRWARMPGKAVLSLAFTYATANNAVLWTVPTGCIFLPDEFFWTVSTTFAGGTSSALGVNSSKTSYTTAGDLLGGAGGDVAATLTAPTPVTKPIFGTVGAGFDDIAKRRMALVAGDTIKLNRIASAFTSGVGAVNIRGTLLRNAGA